LYTGEDFELELEDNREGLRVLFFALELAKNSTINHFRISYMIKLDLMFCVQNHTSPNQDIF
jgi:hypothetical protein